MFETFVCPLCGLQRNLSRWDPDFLPDSIIIREWEGGGRKRGFIKSFESTADVDPGSLDVKSLAKRCLRIVKICLDTNQVSADDLVDDVPEELAEEVVTQKADEYE
jgi:hypothetical protein